jgi:cyclophilin family peptidyl-prolyl cis-trans isomerase
MVSSAFMDVQAGTDRLGRLELVLYSDSVPKTVQNFVHFLQQSETGHGYKGCTFHRVIRGFMAQTGDFINGNGTGSTSLYGTSFDDENFKHRHDRRGILSMANSGKDTNGVQFFITFRPTPHLDGKHVVFGHVDLTKQSSGLVLEALEKVRTERNDRPVLPVTIFDCGISVFEHKEGDDNEISLDVETESDPIETDISRQSGVENYEDNNNVANEVEQAEVEDGKDEELPKSKADALRQRMRRLKMKMNQARQLNQQEVLKEGERLGSVEGAAKARKRQQILDGKAQKGEWEVRNSKALEIAASSGLDGKFLVEQAESSIKKALKKEEKTAANQFEINDYHNPEGMHRNYERNLKSLRHGAGDLSGSSLHDSGATGTFDPTMNLSDEIREREGARSLASEMKRRIEKQKSKRDRIEFEGEDVTYINQRNKRFNQKISRNFDKHTAEIRQNLERGTAL